MSFQKNRAKPNQENRNTRGAQERQGVREHGLQTQVGKQTDVLTAKESGKRRLYIHTWSGKGNKEQKKQIRERQPIKKGAKNKDFKLAEKQTKK